MLIYVPLLIALIGLLVYVLANNKAQELGRIMFLCGVMVTCYQFAGKMFHFTS